MTSLEGDEKAANLHFVSYEISYGVTFFVSSFMSMLVNLFRNRAHFQLLLKSLYTPVFTTHYTEIASMLME